MDTKRETANRLKTALNNACMKPQELADKSGVSKSSISQYINGSHSPSNISSAKMGMVLGVNPMWLMGFAVPMIEDEISERIGDFLAEISKDEIFVVNIEKLWQLSETEREHIFLIVNDLYEKRRKE